MEDIVKENHSLDKLEKRKEKIKTWLNDPYNLVFLGIIIFAIGIFLYYFSLTKNQPLWYDEAEYMSGAVHWAFGVPYQINAQRPILFQFIISLLLKVGFNELAIKFFMSTMPGILSILVTYLLAKEMYDKKIAIITTFMMSVLWILLFYSLRIMTDSITFLLILLTFYFFWAGKINNKGRGYVWLMGLTISLAFMIRLFAALFGAVIFVFLLITKRTKIVKDKNLWIALVVAIVAVSPFLIWYYIYHGGISAIISSNNLQEGVKTLPIAWNLLSYVLVHLEMPYFILFVIGIFTCNLFLSMDLFFKGENKKLYADFFNILVILFVLGFFIFFLRAAEDRWMMPMVFSLFIFSAKGMVFVYNLSKQYIKKYGAIVLIMAILIFGAYVQINHSNQIIELKKNTYSQVREAGLWLNENSMEGDIVFTNSITQNTYYSYRESLDFANPTVNESTFLNRVKEKRPRFLIISIFENYASWAYNPTGKIKDLLIPINVFFLDDKREQPALIIYELNESALDSI